MNSQFSLSAYKNNVNGHKFLRLKLNSWKLFLFIIVQNLILLFNIYLDFACNYLILQKIQKLKIVDEKLLEDF
jgi:hypothetical protein